MHLWRLTGHMFVPNFVMIAPTDIELISIRFPFTQNFKKAHLIAAKDWREIASKCLPPSFIRLKIYVKTKTCLWK